ncbi:MAG: hypothetical protein ACPGTO_02240 [Polaribacter sp.]
MKKFLKILASIIILLVVIIGVYYVVNNERLPKGKQGKEADALAQKMLTALNNEAYKNTEILEWSFRGNHFYKWNKQEDIVDVSWDNNKVALHTNQPKKSNVFVDHKEVDHPKLIKQATAFFNNDSFWLVAPYKIFDAGTERSIVKHNDKDALLVTYTSGGTTPGDSYLWILDDAGFPTSYKMWTKIIPIGGVEVSWNDWKLTTTGIQLPTKHTIALFGGMELNMGNVKTQNSKADILAQRILKAINHKAYKNTKHLIWSFGGRRHYKWNKEQHIVDVSWDTIRVNLHPNSIEKSTVFFNEKLQENADEKIVKRANDFFNNDSFWLVAPHKLFEDGIIRSLQKVDGKDALLVKYTIGGTTPGDSYLWVLDENNIPKSYKMYLKNGRMNGTPATWEDWITTESGTLLPTNHSFNNGGKLSMGKVKGYN